VKSDSALADLDVRGFGARFGVVAEDDVAVRVTGGRIDGRGEDGARGIALHGPGSVLRDVTVAGCEVGVLLVGDGARSDVSRVRFSRCRDEVVTTD